MTLSIALITAEPSARVATILEPLRPYADEIIIAADSRVDSGALAGYDSLADRLFRLEFRSAERHLPWLCAQCSGDWILRLDGDEVPSAAFLRRLPEMLASRKVHQFWARVVWVYPDAEHTLAASPWADSFAVRLVRNDGTLRVRGLPHLHMDPVAPREYVAAPFYHLDLLVSSEDERRDKAIRYEVQRKWLTAPGGGRINEAFYLPELRRALEQRPVPEEDRTPIARALRATPDPSSAQCAAPTAPLVPHDEVDSLWEGRNVRPDAYRARLEPLQPAGSMAPSEQRPVFFYVRNEGSERWPASLDESPQIRVAYRWLHSDGRVHTPEGLRSPFPRPVEPGESILTPVQVAAPAIAGSYVLEVDIVHEYVRWFDCPCRVRMQVGRPAELPPDGARLRATPRARLRRFRAVRIPRTIHRVWLGDSEMPAEFAAFGASFARHHPGWKMRLWTDTDLAALDITTRERAQIRSQSELSNLVRYEVLYRFGGVYVDTDFECKRNLTPLLRGVEAFAALEHPGVVATGVLGSVAGHPVFARAAKLARSTLGLGAHSADANGPYFFSLLLEQEPGLTIFETELFYPYPWSERKERRHESFPDAFAVHHWAGSWLASANGATPQSGA